MLLADDDEGAADDLAAPSIGQISTSTTGMKLKSGRLSESEKRLW